MTESMPWTINDILEATGGVLLSGSRDRVFFDISIDSRHILTDCFFVAIKGKQYDGHDFLEDARAKGVSGILVQNDKTETIPFHNWEKTGMVCVSVSDTIKALGDLANYRRRQSKLSVVAVTGSNGKTTTKEMTAAVLSQRYHVLSTMGNLNNEIGLPLTLFRLERDHERAVLELGMNHPGEIRRLAEICMPDIGVITNIGPSHLEGLGSLEAVKDAKGELLEKINSHGTAVLNADDSYSQELGKKASMDVCYYGLNEPSTVRAQSIVSTGHQMEFDLVLPSESIPINLNTPAKFMISNALAAASVGYLMGISAVEIKAGLESFTPVKGRMNVVETKKGIHLIDDTYNANPGSVNAAIKTLSSLSEHHRSALVLSDMLELGDYSESMHKAIGETAYESGVTKLFLTGDHARDISGGAQSKGMKSSDIFIGTQEEIVEQLSDWMKAGDWILVKGSRSTKMEHVVFGITETNNDRIKKEDSSGNGGSL